MLEGEAGGWLLRVHKALGWRELGSGSGRFDESGTSGDNIEVVLRRSGPVAQLGARFHGMEEVVGSIPTRSTKTPYKLDSNLRSLPVAFVWGRILRAVSEADPGSCSLCNWSVLRILYKAICDSPPVVFPTRLVEACSGGAETHCIHRNLSSADSLAL